MPEEKLPPPIASPVGGGIPSPVSLPDDNSLRLSVDFRTKSLLRYAMSEWFTPFTLGSIVIFPFLFSLVVFPIEFRRWGFAALPIVFALVFAFLVGFSVPLGLLVRFCSKRRFQIHISADGVTKSYPRRNVFFPWRKFLWVIERNGDLWLASFLDGCFIPREAFNSREESHQLVTIIRELKDSDGTIWRPEWNGRTFGPHSDAA